MRSIVLLALVLLFALASQPLAGKKPPCSFLNEGLEYVGGPISGEDIPEGTWFVVIRLASDSELDEWFGTSGHSYWVQEPLTCEQLRLMEYDFLIRGALRDLLIPLHFLDLMSENGILWFGERLHHGWHYLRNMIYPEVVSEIHQKYVEATEAGGWYLGGGIPPTTTTMVYRGLSETGPGGYRAYGYHCCHSTKLRYEATLALIELLEDHDIEPY